jgi:hypothetical protein
MTPAHDLTDAMRQPPNPYRVLAHAIDVGDAGLAAALRRRLFRTAPRRTLERLIRSLRLD